MEGQRDAAEQLAVEDRAEPVEVDRVLEIPALSEGRMKDLLLTFGNDTEAGRLISKLYRTAKEKPKITYPMVKQKTKRQLGLEKSYRERHKWFTGKYGQADPRRNTGTRQKQKQVKAPKFLRAVSSESQFQGLCSSPANGCNIEKVTRKRHKDRIERERRESEKRGEFAGKNEAKKTISTDTEKKRLAMLNYLKGGGRNSSILPKGATTEAMKEQIPLNLLSSKVGQRR